MSSVAVLRGGGERRQRGPSAEALERGADCVGIGGVFEPPTQLPQDLPRARSIVPASLTPIQLSLYGSDFAICRPAASA